MSRITGLARRQLRGFPAVARWEDTDDVAQAVAMRLDRALRAVTPGSLAELTALCAALVRRELIDLKRHYFGPAGLGANHATPAGNQPDSRSVDGRADGTDDPAVLARWTELHATAESLPDELRRVFELLWYLDLTHAEAAEVLEVSQKTVSRRWREARLRLHQLVSDGRV